MTTALDGLRVLDFSWGLAGALVTMVLCDNGAEVVKVEAPGGDPQRLMPAFRMWHRGKKSVVLDLKTPTGREQARALAGRADVLVQTWRPGVAERLGLGYDALAEANPGLIYCAITGFGPRGPYAHLKGYEAIVAAKAGILAEFAGLVAREGPAYAAVPAASFGASQAALQGIFAALYVRGRTGEGQKVETSLVQGLTAYELYNWLGLQLPPSEDGRQPRAESPRNLFFGMLVAWTRDGKWLQFANALPHQFGAFLRALGLEEYYREAAANGEDPQRIEDRLHERLQEKTLDEWMAIFAEYDDLGVEPFRTTREGMAHPQVLHNRHVIPVDDPDVGRIAQIGPLVDLSATPARVERPAPRLGEHTEEVLTSWTTALTSGRSPDPGRREQGAQRPEGTHPVPGEEGNPWSVVSRPSSSTQSSGPGSQSASGPLAGVTVVELGWYYAAPFGVALLADLGARVIKVENLEGDPHRFQYPLREFGGVKGLQGKESVAVNLTTPEGREILHRLIARADLVMRNFRQASSEAMGVDYASLRPANPNIVYLYAAAYGASGPSAKRPAYAPTMAAVVGEGPYQLGWRTVFDGGDPLDFAEGKRRYAQLRRANGITGNADATAALGVGTALLLGLVARERTGRGQELQTTMIGTNAYAVSDDFLAYAGKPERPLPDPELLGMGALYRLYRASAGWVFLACPLGEEWDALCVALKATTGGAVDLAADPRFAAAEGRRAHDAALAEALAHCFAERPARAWEELLTAADVACVEVSDEPFCRFTIASPVMRENGFVGEVTHPVFGTHVRHGPIVTLSRTPGSVRPAPLIGQHTRAVLTELGYTEAQIEDLAARQIVRL